MSATRTCYAKYLGDCGGGISREHYLSAGILEILNDTRQLAVRGYPFLDGAEMRLAPAALQARVLCRRHNSELSGLDEIAVKLFRWVQSVQRGTWTRDRLAVDGVCLERWALKLYVGLLASGQGATTDGTRLPSDPFPSLVDIVFGRNLLPPGAGLHYTLAKGEVHERRSTGVTFRPWSNLSFEPAAIDVDINGLRFICSFDPAFEVATRHYRPAEIRITSPSWSRPKRLVFAWPGAHRGATITLDARWHRGERNRPA